MSLAITFLICAPFIAITCIAIAADERWQLTDRVAHTSIGRRVRALIARHIDA